MHDFKIPLTFQEQPVWSAPAKPFIKYLASAYKASGHRQTQPVLSNRNLLSPDIDLNHYKCQAVIDWIDLRLETLNTHQAVNIQRNIAKKLKARGSVSTIYVMGPNKEPRYQGETFILKLQQPQPAELADLLYDILSEYPTYEDRASEVQIAGIEISIDFYVKPDATVDAETMILRRWQMTDVLRRHLKPEPILTRDDQCHPRFFWKNGAQFFVKETPVALGQHAQDELIRLGVDERFWAPFSLRAHHQPQIDATSWIGKKDHPVMLRIMDKVTDQRNPSTNTHLDLSPDLHRSRVEVTLQGDIGTLGAHGALNFITVSDLYGHKFQDIRPPIFAFYLPTIGSTCDTTSLPFPTKVREIEVFKLSGTYGLDLLHRSIEAVQQAQFHQGDISRRPTVLRKKGRTISYVALNQKVDRALRGLAKKWAIPPDSLHRDRMALAA